VSDVDAPKVGLMNIGEEAKPPFAVLPDPLRLFTTRALRFGTLAKGHELGPYLEFLGKLCQAQADIVAGLPPLTLPSAEHLAQSHEHAMPPLSRDAFEPDAVYAATLAALLVRIDGAKWPEASLAAAARLRAMLPTEAHALVRQVLAGSPPDALIAEYVLMAAALQVHFARLARSLDAESLKPIADGACPACGSEPVSSAVVGWPKAHNTRFCSCSLCATMWNVVRVKCVVCSSTEGISYLEIKDKPDTVKAETCEKCRSYLKILYQVKDPALEPVADDVATLGLDILLSGEDPAWRRAGNNAFLTGY